MKNPTVTNRVGIEEDTVSHNRTTIRGPAIIGDYGEIGPNTYIGPYTSTGDYTTLRNTEIEYTIIEATHIDCDRLIVEDHSAVSV